MLQIESLTKRFGGKAAVDGVTLAIPAGQMVGVIGRSGAGKSTLLRLINRLADPTSGHIRSDGRDVSRLTGRPLRAWRRDTAMIFQQFNLVGRLDVLTNVLLGRLEHRSAFLTLAGSFSKADKVRAVEALERLDMAGLMGQRAETLSGGQQQRVAIARALVQEPRIILADEPIASLDPRNTQVVMDALRRINREENITVVCNLHDLDIAQAYCGRLIGMRAGRVVFDGAPSDLTGDIAADLYGIGAAEAGALVQRPGDPQTTDSGHPAFAPRSRAAA
jgi:phosphonate transport system ATP-binding protein